ncbi:MAG TPA: polyprenyl synthetase family protein [Gemmatimonadaceae bacterium]|nr:polyprenyl synthetase family protein [Gemmatimonadaceae bacterium]
MTVRADSSPELADTLRQIQTPVEDGLRQVIGEMWRIVATDNPLVTDVNAHLLLAKGKMVRPTLLLLSSHVDGSAEPRATTLAAVAELIHLATLVHDDAVDHSVMRRGRPTINALFSHQVSVIMGDFLYSRALSELVRLGDMEPLAVFTAASNALTLGEMRQLAALDALAFTEDDYDTLIESKTASLFAAACEVGSLCGAQRHRAALTRFGQRLGMAFQVADDLLDYTEDQETTGKPTGLDLREHKVTLPLIAALRTMPPAARKRVDVLFADPDPDDGLIAEVVDIVREQGGLEYARRRGEEFAQEAEVALAELPDSPYRSALAGAIGYVMDRRF